MKQPVGRILQLRLYPVRPLWSIGSGWAAIGGGLAVGGLALSSESLLKLLLAWFLADPLLGMVWDVGIGGGPFAPQMGMWQHLLNPGLPDAAAPVLTLPYVQVNSPGHRLTEFLGRLRYWWRVTFWPEASREFSTLVAALGLALLLGVILGRSALALVLFSSVLSWLAVLSQGKVTVIASAQPDRGRRSMVTFWHALGEFAIPWLIGGVAMGKLSWASVLLGTCYTITYFGLIGHALDFRLVGASQVVAALLLTGLRYPFSAGAMAILLMPQWGLHACAAYSPVEGDKRRNAYLRVVQPFVILSMLIAALTVAS